MDTKLKNYHKLTAVIVALVILLPSLAMMIIRPHYIRQQNKQENLSFTESGLLNQLVENCYVLYGEELQSKNNNTLSAYDMFFSTGETKTAESTSSETTDSQDYTDIDSVVYDMEENTTIGSLIFLIFVLIWNTTYWTEKARILSTPTVAARRRKILSIRRFPICGRRVS